MVKLNHSYNKGKLFKLHFVYILTVSHQQKLQTDIKSVIVLTIFTLYKNPIKRVTVAMTIFSPLLNN